MDIRPFASNFGSGMSMPCWRMHLANSSAACLGSVLPPALVVAVGWPDPLRLATPPVLSSAPAQAAWACRASPVAAIVHEALLLVARVPGACGSEWARRASHRSRTGLPGLG